MGETARRLFPAFILCFGAGSALAQGDLRIGIGDDPDVLDPTLSHTYSGRIVFASPCDKPFDIDEKLAIVRRLAPGHETSPDGRPLTLELGPGVKFHDDEPRQGLDLLPLPSAEPGHAHRAAGRLSADLGRHHSRCGARVEVGTEA